MTSVPSRNRISIPDSGDPHRGDASFRAASLNVSRTASEMLDELTRFTGRTISHSHYSHDIHEEVQEALAGVHTTNPAEDYEDEDEEHQEAERSQQPQEWQRDSQHAISNFETMIHLLKGNIGIGVLTLPMAIKNAGLVLGSIGLAVIAIICVHCMKLLVHAAHKACDRRLNCQFLDYADTGEAIFVHAGGRWRKCATLFRKVINVFVCLTQVGSNAVYVLFIAQNLQPILAEHSTFFAALNYRYIIAMIVLPLSIVCCVRNLRYLSPFSILATILQAVGLGMLFYFLFRDPLPDSRSLPWVADVSTWPLFFGTAIFAIEGICIVLPIENQMKSPREMLGFTGVLNTSMSLVAILYIAMGFYGYLKYGENIESSITLNLPSESIMAQVVLLLFSISIFFSYALQFYVLMDIVGPNVIQPRVSERWYSVTEYLTRFALNAITFLLAASVPWLDLLVSLLGAVKMSTLAIMAPALIDMACDWTDGAPNSKIRWAKNAFIFIFGLFGCVIGTYVSVLNIIWNFTDHRS